MVFFLCDSNVYSLTFNFPDLHKGNQLQVFQFGIAVGTIGPTIPIITSTNNNESPLHLPRMHQAIRFYPQLSQACKDDSLGDQTA